MGKSAQFPTSERLKRSAPMRLALFEPDIPQNAGTLLRLAACLDLAVDVIEPCGFVWSDARLKRAGLDYMDRARLTRWKSWDQYRAERPPGRLVLLTTQAGLAYTGFAFRGDDTLMVGRESSGAPDVVHAAADARLAVPMRPGARSLNVAVAAAMVAGEALRQTGGFPTT